MLSGSTSELGWIVDHAHSNAQQMKRRTRSAKASTAPVGPSGASCRTSGQEVARCVFLLFCLFLASKVCSKDHDQGDNTVQPYAPSARNAPAAVQDCKAW